MGQESKSNRNSFCFLKLFLSSGVLGTPARQKDLLEISLSTQHHPVMGFGVWVHRWMDIRETPVRDCKAVREFTPPVQFML